MPPNETDAVLAATLPIKNSLPLKEFEKTSFVNKEEAKDEDVISTQPKELEKLTLPSKTESSEPPKLKEQFDSVSCLTCIALCCEFMSQCCLSIGACCQAGCGECIDGTCEGCLACCEACGQFCLMCAA